MTNALKYTLIAILFLLLTIVTQIGGIIYLCSIFTSKKWKKEFKGKFFSIFVATYLIATIVVVPLVAPFFGREKVNHLNNINPTNYLTVILNRNYVTPEMNSLLKVVSESLQNSNSPIEIRYLDANFPFINKFPLLPHLSHNDGKKLDISLVYQTSTGKITNQKKSISGYGVFESPKNKEYNQIKKCKSAGYFQYDYPKYLTFGSINDELRFSESGTKILIRALLQQPDLGKIFIEPHLKQRLNLSDNRIRYHGCQAVRHDDHIHIQLK